MSPDHVREALAAAVARHRPGPGPGPLDESTRLVDLGLSSLQVVEVILDLEDRFGVTIEVTAVSPASTVGEFLAWLSGRLGAPGGA